jgi:sec-independent protein translocase protein TatC
MLNIQFHFFELKLRFIYLCFSFFVTFLSSYLYSEILIYLYTLPLLKIQLLSAKLIQSNFIFTNLSDVFHSHIYVTTSITLYFTFIIFIYHIFSYLSIGLFYYEKKRFLNFFYGLFLYFSCLVFFITQFFLPIFIKFFLSFENIKQKNLFTIRYEANLFDYLVLNNLFIFFLVLICLIPPILFYISQINLVSSTFFKKHRRFFIISFFIIGGIFSPPDLYSQLLIAFPLLCCFEFILFIFCLKKIYTTKFHTDLFNPLFKTKFL